MFRESFLHRHSSVGYMKKSLYYVIPIVAFGLVLTNAFFGHLIFGSPYNQDINKYSIYVHLQDNWKSAPGNILFDVTNVWSNPDPKSDARSFSINPYDLSLLTDYNSNQLQHQGDKSYVELKHEFSNCDSNWKPMLYRYVIDGIRNKIGIIQGTQLNDDPYVSLVPNIRNLEYDESIQETFVNNVYVQFVPICTSHESTTYEYSISINDPKIGFDVYFVPSYQEIFKFLDGESFSFYHQGRCIAHNFQSYSGVCQNVSKHSGLMIILPDNLELSITKVRINLHELL